MTRGPWVLSMVPDPGTRWKRNLRALVSDGMGLAVWGRGPHPGPLLL